MKNIPDKKRSVVKNDFQPFAETYLLPSEVDYTKVDSSWRIFAPFYPYFRIYYITEGAATLYMKDEVMNLEPGYMYFIPAFSIAGASCDDTMVHYWMHFTLDETTCNYMTICKPLKKVKANPTDLTVFNLLYEEFKKNHTISTPVACSGLAKYLFSRFITEENLDLGMLQYAQVLQYIDKNIDQNITNTDLANLLYLSPTYFSNTFSKKFGVSPKKYIITQKMSKASKLIAEGEKTIKEIAGSLGFDNDAYFNRLFTSYMKISPGQYKKLFTNK